jgi:hypothetical protein
MGTKGTKEEMEKSKTELLNKLTEMSISPDNLDWVNEQLDQTINEEVEEQNKNSNKNNIVLDDVSKQSELLKAFIDFYNYRNTGDKTINNDEIEIFIDSL